MIKALFKPFFKKFLGLFISMAFVSMLSIGLLCCFGSTIYNLKESYSRYLDEYGYVDEQVSTSFTSRQTLLETVQAVEGVDKVDARLTIDAYLQKDDGRTIVSRIFSYNEATNTVFKRYVLESTLKSEEHVNISITRKFARNNGFKLGNLIKIGYFGFYVDFHVSEIVETVEGITPRANDYVWSDNQDFGYLYIDEAELNTALSTLSEMIKNNMSDPEYEEAYNSFISVSGLNFPDLQHLEEGFASSFANQLLVRNTNGQDEEAVATRIKTALNNESIEPKSITIGKNLVYRIYMENCIRQLSVAAVFLPVFFYSVTMIVIGLFMNQIIKTMTPEIGVLMSIGIDKKDIISIYILYAGLMAIVAGIVGSLIGYGLNILMTSTLIEAYSIPIIPFSLNALFIIISTVTLLIFAELATFLSCLAIFKITPKDATISNEAKRKQLPKGLEKFIDKAPPNIKLSTNSIAQNPKRFIVSSFSMFASMVLILLSTFFYVSKEEMISQSVDRRLNYECQVYLTQKEDDAFINDVKMQSFVEKDEENNPLFEDAYYTYVKVDNVDKDIYLECLAVNPGKKKLINIPDTSGKGELAVPNEGIILTSTAADQLGVGKGDTITINGHDVVISDISCQYFHPITYLSKSQMDAFGVDYVSSFILNISNEKEFLTYLAENKNQCLTVFTKSLAKDMYSIFDALNIFIVIMIAFSLGIAFVILSIMSQNQLLEQKRQLSVLRAIGFTVLDISNFWTLQSVLQLLLSCIIGVPAGCLFAMLLFSICSNASQIYPFIFSLPVVLIAIAFILLVVVVCHTIAMRRIASWNIADNTRSRE